MGMNMGGVGRLESKKPVERMQAMVAAATQGVARLEFGRHAR
jgi:hypothetical protein